MRSNEAQVGQNVVEIDGSEGASVQLATCCRPIPGDEVAGYFGGEGLTVHTQECSIGRRLRERDGERWMDVDWAEQLTRQFETSVSVLVAEHQGRAGAGRAGRSARPRPTSRTSTWATSAPAETTELKPARERARPAAPGRRAAHPEAGVVGAARLPREALNVVKDFRRLMLAGAAVVAVLLGIVIFAAHDAKHRILQALGPRTTVGSISLRYPTVTLHDVHVAASDAPGRVAVGPGIRRAGGGRRHHRRQPLGLSPRRAAGDRGRARARRLR